MTSIQRFIGAIIGIALMASCKTQQPTNLDIAESIMLDTMIVPLEVLPPYKASETRFFNLIHTKLDVKFNFEKQQLIGNAQLKLVPYFYPQKELVLDAQGFDLNGVGVRFNGKLTALRYDYDGQKLKIYLDRTYTRKDSVYAWIDYVAKPNELESQGSDAITDAKGLYFIDPTDEDPHKPTQIWTQGETESNSAWFPTIDSPNENMTQDITITVDSKYETLSNGKKVSTQENGDGTRTDRWVQNLPHAPYLCMMAIGEFAVVKDKWQDIDVHYFVEPEFEEFADDIFGHTPEMLGFFSKLLKYPYPWQKYHQVVVRDYVSGAMENTTAVIHGEFLHQTDREMLDGDYEDVISHELFHHWFGDIVTCESWSNLPLNESFATYGEYLWREHKYGRFSADDHGNEQQSIYLMEAGRKMVDMVRFNYEDEMEMFDAHSYQKGGCILHMLRKHLGDSAFFESLHVYLKEHKFSAVEMHDFRMACEKVSGEDLNWFFNQWFYAKGHPVVKIDHTYDDASKTYSITISQEQDFEKVPIYRLPITVDIYWNSQLTRETVWLEKTTQTFQFKVRGEPQLVNVDAEKCLLWEKNESLSTEQLIFKLKNGPLLMDKMEALNDLNAASSIPAKEVLVSSLDHEYGRVRAGALQVLKRVQSPTDSPELGKKIKRMLATDKEASVRSAALDYLNNLGDEGISVSDLERSIQDPSYRVAAKSLKLLGKKDMEMALLLASELEEDARGSLITTIATLYGDNGGPEKLPFFQKTMKSVAGFNEKYMMIQVFGAYLLNQDMATQERGLEDLKRISMEESAWFIRLSGIQVLSEMAFRHRESPQMLAKVSAILEEVKLKETNAKVLQLLGQ